MKLINTLVEITGQGVRDRINPEGKKHEDFMKVLRLWNQAGKINHYVLELLREEDYLKFYIQEYWKLFGKKKLEDLNNDIKGNIVELRNKEPFQLFQIFVRLKINGFEVKEYDNFHNNDLDLSYDILDGSYLEVPKLFGGDKLDLIKVIGRGDEEFNDKYARVMMNENTYDIIMTRLRLTILNEYVNPLELHLLTGIWPLVLIRQHNYRDRSKGN